MALANLKNCFNISMHKGSVVKVRLSVKRRFYLVSFTVTKQTAPVTRLGRTARLTGLL